MESTKTTVLIVDDNYEVATNLKQDLLKDESLEVINTVTSVAEAMNCIQNSPVDLVITDIVLKEEDGFELLSKISALSHKPKVVVVSAISQEGFIAKAVQMGASYYMIKPYKSEILIRRIKELMESTDVYESEEIKMLKNLDEKISNIFITVGIPPHIKGYQFLREAIKMAIRQPDIINSITKKLYPSIAEKYETSSSKVERAIRHAIEVAWNRGKIENINALFGVKVYSNNEKPTNGEFIALVADKMLLEGVK